MFTSVRLTCLLALTVLSMSTLVTSEPETQHRPLCKQVVIPVTITANNRAFPPTLTLNSALLTNVIASALNLLFSNVVHGTYNIAATYCEPAVNIPSRRNTLQLLAHPATYDRNYWSPADPQYSWIAYASSQGYPTLAIDRLGNGNSSHPDPILVVQCPAQAATISALVGLARGGASPFPRKFETFIFVGSSLGSLVGNVGNDLYPDDFDATILTGFSKFWANVLPGFITTAGLLPASLVSPKTRGSFPVGYLEPTSQRGVEYLLFYGPNQYYNRSVILSDFATRGTISVGEGVSGGLGITTAPGYTGDVLVMTGAQDVVFCGTLAVPAAGPGDCGASGILEETGMLYPNARNYTYFVIDNTGHCWEHQYGAMAWFGRAHRWLEERGY